MLSLLSKEELLIFEFIEHTLINHDMIKPFTFYSLREKIGGNSY